MTPSNTKRIFYFLGGLFALVLAVQCKSRPAAGTEADAAALSPDAIVSIERGQHLVIGGACHDCHSPKTMTPAGPRVDSARMLSGHPADSPLPALLEGAMKPGGWVLFAPDLTAFLGPWGLSFSANLTSDSATGIGAWNEANFVNAIRSGRHMGLENGRHISPPMPWENYRNLSDNDLKSIFAYLKSVPPVHNRVHEPYSPEEARALLAKKK